MITRCLIVITKGPKPEVGKSCLSATYINVSNHKESEHESANCLLREGDTRLYDLFLVESLNDGNACLSGVTTPIDKINLVEGDTCLSSAAKISVNDEASISALINIDNYSSLNKLLRVTSYVLRFIHNVKRRLLQKKRPGAEDVQVENNYKNLRVFPEDQMNGVLSVMEIDKSRTLWLKNIQKTMKQNTNYPQLKFQLRVFSDELGLLRCAGRLGNAPIPYDAKFPILLPSNDRFTDLIILDAHVLAEHSLYNNTLIQLRQKFWIPKGRQYVKKVIKQCRSCRHFDKKPLKYPNPPDLPEVRLRDKHAFDAVGIDYAGPVYVKNIYGESRKMYKAWIGLIICASSRAIYLDLVADSSSTECINLLKRFISRYGAPNNIISDNGKCFISEETQNFASTRNIIWRFNLESAPWQGGFFERMVQTTKRCLKKMLVNARLNFLEMLTLLSRIEVIINNRPLTYMYNDIFDIPITPNSLIYGRVVNQVGKDNINNYEFINEYEKNITERVKYLNDLLSHFWNRWKIEYIVDLRERTKLKNKEIINSITENDIVLVVNEKAPRCQWRVGKVIDLIKGKDDKIRGAKVLTKTLLIKKTAITVP